MTTSSPSEFWRSVSRSISTSMPMANSSRPPERIDCTRGPSGRSTWATPYPATSASFLPKSGTWQ